MSLELPGTIPLELSKGNTLESLYEISDQNIWFLTWILKKVRFWPDLTREALEAPFAVVKHIFLLPSIGNCIYINKNNINHGIYHRWYENGELMLEIHLKDGDKHGTEHHWYDNGQLHVEQYWRNGVIDGIERYWYASGHIWSETEWKYSIKHGPSREWFRNGKLKTEQYWTNGKRNGIFRDWNETGQLQMEKHWKDGIKFYDINKNN